MKGLRKQCPEIPVVLGGTHACPWVTFYSPVQIREIMYITKEKCGRVISHQVPVSLFRIKFYSHTADITLRIRGPPLPGNRGETDKKLCLCTGLQDLRFCIFGNIVGNRKFSVGSPSFGMHSALRYHFTVKMRQFFHQPHILHEYRASRTCCQGMFIFCHRCTGFIRKFPFVFFHALISFFSDTSVTNEVTRAP